MFSAKFLELLSENVEKCSLNGILPERLLKSTEKVVVRVSIWAIPGGICPVRWLWERFLKDVGI